MKTIYATPNDDIQHIVNEIDCPTTLVLSKGVYRQKIEIMTNDVTIVGEKEDETIILWDDYSKKFHKDGWEYNTFRTYTLCVTGARVTLENLTVVNDNPDPRTAGQCVALSVHGDDFRARHVTLRSLQDTLFLSPFPDDLVLRYRGFLPERQLYREGTPVQTFRQCTIYGTVDFIFGSGEACFYDCRIVSLADPRKTGYVAAPSHALSQKNGFTFYRCDFVSEGAPDDSQYLARPWRDFGKCTFLDCHVGRHVKPCLFDHWNGTTREKTCRMDYYALQCDFTPTPVSWSRALTKEQATEKLDALQSILSLS